MPRNPLPKAVLEAARKEYEQALPGILADLWSGIEQDSKGNPESRLAAVKAAARCREFGLGPRRAAKEFGRPEGDNGAQRYFTVAKALTEGIEEADGHVSFPITEDTIRETPITTLAEFIAQCKADGKVSIADVAAGEPDAAGMRPSEEARVEAVGKLWKKLYKMVEKHRDLYNVDEMLAALLNGENIESNLRPVAITETVDPVATAVADAELSLSAEALAGASN